MPRSRISVAAAIAPVMAARNSDVAKLMRFTPASVSSFTVKDLPRIPAMKLTGFDTAAQTARTAAEFGLRVDVTAAKPSATALVDALAEYGARIRDAAVAAGEPVRKPSERRRGARRRLR